MSRYLQVALGIWFAIAMTWAQACVPPTQTANRYSSTNTVSQLGGVGSSGAADSSSGYRAAPASAGESHIDTQAYTADKGESQALTQYLTAHKLPLVGAQVLNGSGGERAVVLYGFTGSDFGKSDAASKARRFLADPSVTVDNRIKVRPELLASGSSAPPPSSSSADAQSETGSYPGVQNYVDQQNQNQAQALQQYQQQQQQGAMMSTAVPLIALLAIVGMMAASNGSFAVGPGSIGPPGSFSPFGPPTPYNPYPGFPSPSYPPSFGSPYAPSSPYYP